MVDKPKVGKPKVGRPTVMTPEVLGKTKEAYLMGCSTQEAAAFADIGFRTLYDYIEANPEFSQKVDAWKLSPFLKAKRTIIDSLDDTKNAQWYLERRAKEFKPKQDMTTNDKDLPTPILNGIEAINVQTNNSSQETTGLNEKN